MPLKESYVIWNNKGGVGKTTLTFHMATRYAKRNPAVKVLVIDLCPQANVSMALLSSLDQQGSDHLSTLYREKKTISFYLEGLTEMGRKLINAKQFLTRVDKHNNQVPANLFLVCGDMCLEFVARSLNNLRLEVDMPLNKPWKWVTSSIRSFIEGLDDKITGVTQDCQDEWVVFIDTNPSFSVYTEIALAAANKLIIPINADDFSVTAVRAVLALVYGITTPNEGPEDFATCMFNYKARMYKLRLPQIHLLINNRMTTLPTRSAEAVKHVKVMGEENLKVLFEAYCRRQHQECFSPRDGEEMTIEAFKEQYFVDMRDFHTTGILSLHIGRPLEVLAGKVPLSKEVSIQVNKPKVDECLRCLDNLVERL